MGLACVACGDSACKNVHLQVHRRWRSGASTLPHTAATHRASDNCTQAAREWAQHMGRRCVFAIQLVRHKVLAPAALAFVVLTTPVATEAATQDSAVAADMGSVTARPPISLFPHSDAETDSDLLEVEAAFARTLAHCSADSNAADASSATSDLLESLAAPAAFVADALAPEPGALEDPHRSPPALLEGDPRRRAAQLRHIAELSEDSLLRLEATRGAGLWPEGQTADVERFDSCAFEMGAEQADPGDRNDGGGGAAAAAAAGGTVVASGAITPANPLRSVRIISADVRTLTAFPVLILAYASLTLPRSSNCLLPNVIVQKVSAAALRCSGRGGASGAAEFRGAAAHVGGVGRRCDAGPRAGCDPCVGEQGEL